MNKHAPIEDKIADESGQMAVELAIVTPIILIILIIVIDALVFMNECARFDHLAPQYVLSCAVSPAKDGYDASARTAAIQERLDAEFAKRGSSVEVKAADANVALASMTTYTCTFRFVPWPFTSAASPGYLEHTCALTVDPYTPGEII